jgi:hypothetical protein
MDPATLALTAAGLLAKKALEAAGGKAGEGAWATLGRIAETIRAKFRADPEATEALNRLEAKPDQQFTELIGQLHQRSRGTYGAPGSSLARARCEDMLLGWYSELVAPGGQHAAQPVTVNVAEATLPLRSPLARKVSRLPG